MEFAKTVNQNLVNQIQETFYGIGINLDNRAYEELAKRCSSCDGALEYYFSNPTLFVSYTEVTTDTDQRKVNDISSLADHERNYNSIANGMRLAGFTTEQIEYALPRCSSLQAAFLLFCEGISIEEVKYTCPLCMDDYPVSSMISLSCEPVPHRFCKDCFEGYCGNKILENLVQDEELCCPAIDNITSKKCGTPITIFELEANISSELFEKYERFKTRAYCETENMRRCPKCNEWYIDMSQALGDEDIWKMIRCGKCKHEFCGKCGEKPHKRQADQDIDCEEYSRWRQENEKGDESFALYMKEKKIFPCPRCHNAGELKSGCKFLYCRCKANFCALCGVQLKEQQHFAHFQNGPNCTGPFGEGCLGPSDTAGVDK